MKPFSEQLKTIMNIRNITQSELCDKTGIPKSALSQYLSGAFRPKQERTYLLAQALRTTQEFLMGLTDNPEIPIADERIQGMLVGSDRIRLAIARKQLSITDLERMTGIPKPMLKQYVFDKTEDIPVEVIEKIAAATDVSAEYLMGEGIDSESFVAPENHSLDGFLSVVNYAQDNGISPEDLRKIIDCALTMRGGMQ